MAPGRTLPAWRWHASRCIVVTVAGDPVFCAPHTSVMKDLHSLGDIITVVDAFYSDIDRDPVLGPYFSGLEMEGHLQKMYAFWSSVVFQAGAYRGRPFDVHARLSGLEARHFTQWLQRFTEIIDDRFSGPNANRMKSRAAQVAWVLSSRLCTDTLPESMLRAGEVSAPPGAEASL